MGNSSINNFLCDYFQFRGALIGAEEPYAAGLHTAARTHSDTLLRLILIQTGVFSCILVSGPGRP